MNARTLSPWRPALAALALVTAAPMAAQAASKSVVVRDAETGQLRAPNAEEAKALNSASGKAAARRSAPAAAAAPEARTLPNGAVAMDLDESTMVYAVARRNADGTISRFDVQGKEAAEKATKAPKNFAKPMTAKTTREAGYELK